MDYEVLLVVSFYSRVSLHNDRDALVLTMRNFCTVPEIDRVLSCQRFLFLTLAFPL
jgi:hypothetical protein